MKKSLIPILSLLFIISLDSCKKDSDNNQPEETTRVVKLNYSQRSTNSSITDSETTYFEYDNSGRIISLKDSADPSYHVTISYVGDEAIVQEAFEPGEFNYSVRYKLNSDHLPVQRIIAETLDNMTGANPRFVLTGDTCKYEYDAAGLLVKATGTHSDTSWSKNNNQSVYYSAGKKTYTISYTNKDGKLMSAEIIGIQAYSSTQVGGNTYKSNTRTEENYSYEYTKNYANKVDKINAWLFDNMETLYEENIPAIKYAYLPDIMNHTTKTTDLATGSETSNYTHPTQTRELEYSPSGFISSIVYSDRSNWKKYWFTYNK